MDIRSAGSPVSEIAPALVASAGVGRYQRKCTSFLPAAQDREADASPNLDVGDANLLNLRQLGRIVLQRLEKFIERRPATFDLNGDARGGVEDIPTQPERGGHLVNKRPKPHTLHDSTHQDVLASDRFVKLIGLEAEHPPHHTWPRAIQIRALLDSNSHIHPLRESPPCPSCVRTVPPS